MALDWEAVYRRTYPELVRFLHRKVWDEDRARELAQEAFVRGLRQEPGTVDEPRAWLFQVARNLARDEARTVLRRREHLALLEGGAEEGAPPRGPERVEAREIRERVRAALEELSDGDREILLLWDAGLSYREIAEQTGLAHGSIGTTLARARRRLVDAYEGREEHDAARR